MSESVRQNNLFAAEDWKVVYSAFRNVSLQAYDYDTIYNALVEYLRVNNPDEFNDYVEHSEMIAHINMLAYLGQAYAFRIDLNARENFFDTAERRESVIKLARALTYNPKRNRAAHGICKIVSLTTSEPIQDAQGNNLANREIVWDQINDPNWYDNFVRILNRSFVSTNRFGDPVKEANIDGVRTEVYSINSVKGRSVTHPFTSTVNGQTRSFEAVPAYTDGDFIIEKSPAPENAFNVVYRNDQLGNSSKDTGFFIMFKEGALEYRDFQYDSPVPDREELINVENINETDVWLQEIDPDTGYVKKEWEQVPSLVGQNIIYNDIYLKQRNIYAVTTEANNRIRITYSDGNFGNVPVGAFRVWYRRSANESYIIRPNDMRNRTITISYVGKDNQVYNLRIKFSLQYTVDNAEGEETTEEIKRNAPLVHYTQDRMINGEDYNVFPLTQSNLIRKIKSVNRTHAGHSRYIDITDPTGAHSNVTVVGDDAYLYKTYGLNSEAVTIETNTNYPALVRNQLEPMLSVYGLSNFYYHEYRSLILSDEFDDLGGYGPDFLTFPDRKYVWKTLPKNQYGTTGYFVDAQSGENIEVGLGAQSEQLKLVRENSKLRMVNGNGDEEWVTLRSLQEGGNVNLSYMTKGTVELSSNVHEGWYIKEVIPGIREYLDINERILVQNELENNRSFGLRFDFINDKWELISQENIVNTDDTTFDLKAPELPNQPDNRWLIKALFVNDQGKKKYNMFNRQMRYIFGSDKQVRFFFKNTDKVIDYETGKAVQDYVRILDANTDRTDKQEENTTARAIIGHFYTSPTHSADTEYDITMVLPANANYGNVKLYTVNKKEIRGWSIERKNGKTLLKIDSPLLPENTVTPFKVSDLIDVYDVEGGKSTLVRNYDFSVKSSFIQSDGVVDYSKVLIEPKDSDDDGVPDYPLAFEDIVNLNEIIVFKTYTDVDNVIYSRIDPSVKVLNDHATTIMPGEIYYCKDNVDIRNNNGDVISYQAGNFYIGMDDPDSDIRLNQAELLVNNTDSEGHVYSAYTGRTFTPDDPFLFQWKHYAGGTDRIDPSISNVIDTYVLTRSYDNAVRTWLNNRDPIEQFPQVPTSNEIKNNLKFIERKKSTSDQIIYIPAQYKLLFGPTALPEYRAKFKAVKAVGAILTDNEIKSKVVEAINEFFDIDNWDFGEGFFFTELSTYIHTKLLGNIASIVIVPENENSRFGELFEIRSEPNELFLSTATVDNVELVRTYTDSNLRKR